MAEMLPPLQAEPRAGVLVIHSWWGLTSSFRNFGHHLADRGFLVGLSDLFDGRIASSPSEAKQLRSMRRREPMCKSLIRDLYEVQARVKAPVGVVGFSMGGHWAVWLSQQPRLPVGSAVLYYAVRGGNFAQSRASYLAHFAERDEWVKSAARRKMERQIEAAGRPYAAYDYPGTGHWFAETDRPDDYMADAAELALERTVDHLEACLCA